MRLGSLKSRHPEEYALLRAERDGEYYEQRDEFEQGRTVQGSRGHRAFSDLRFGPRARVIRSSGRGEDAAPRLENLCISPSSPSPSSRSPYLWGLLMTVALPEPL